MRNLCLKPSMTVGLILTSFLQAKKMDASKATAHHIKHIARDLQTAQINLMRHQLTDLPPCKNKRKAFKSRQPTHKYHTSEQQVPPYKRKFDPKQAHTSKERCSKCGDSGNIEGFKCPVRKYQWKSCLKYGHLTSLCFKKQVPFKSRAPKEHLLQTEEVHMQDDSICGQSEDFTSSDDSFCLQVRIQCVQAEFKFPKTSHLITNLAYKPKPHHKRNQYLRARLDICTAVNIMPPSVYKLVFCDPDLKKLAPSRLEFGTYTSDTVKLAGSKCFVILCHHICTWLDTALH